MSAPTRAETAAKQQALISTDKTLKSIREIQNRASGAERWGANLRSLFLRDYRLGKNTGVFWTKQEHKQQDVWCNSSLLREKTHHPVKDYGNYQQYHVPKLNLTRNKTKRKSFNFTLIHTVKWKYCNFNFCLAYFVSQLMFFLAAGYSLEKRFQVSGSTTIF